MDYTSDNSAASAPGFILPVLDVPVASKSQPLSLLQGQSPLWLWSPAWAAHVPKLPPPGLSPWCHQDDICGTWSCSPCDWETTAKPIPLLNSRRGKLGKMLWHQQDPAPLALWAATSRPQLLLDSPRAAPTWEQYPQPPQFAPLLQRHQPQLVDRSYSILGKY